MGVNAALAAQLGGSEAVSRHHAGMSLFLFTAALLLLFLAFTLWIEKAPLAGWLGLGLLAVAAGYCFYELARYDLGYPEIVAWIGWLACPIIVIFGASAWGTRRFYGWPNLGPHPGRAAIVAGAIVLGMLAGADKHVEDERTTLRLVREIHAKLEARAKATGHWPASLEAVGHADARSSMGTIDPPPIRYGLDHNGQPSLAFAVSSSVYRTLELAHGDLRLRPDRPRPIDAASPPAYVAGSDEAAEAPK